MVNLDLRYSRFMPFSDAQRLELFFEAKNLFNTQNMSAVNRDVTTDAAGILAALAAVSVPAARAPTTSGRCSWELSSLSDAVMSIPNSQVPTSKALPTPKGQLEVGLGVGGWECLGPWDLEVGS